MILTLSTTHTPATDLGYLLMKHPDRVHEKAMSFGRAVLFFPHATHELCTAALMLDVDPIAQVRGRETWSGGLFGHYVTDRPYVASSFLSVAISRLLNSALGGRSRERQALADTALPLQACLAPVPVRGGVDLLERLFAPLGYTVDAEQHALDPGHPEWGDSPYYTVRLSAQLRLCELLAHLFVLVPVLDNHKHYWVGTDEVDKLLAKGEGWLEQHPEQDLITRRYLKHRPELTRAAAEVLADRVGPAGVDIETAQAAGEAALEAPLRLNDLRMQVVADTLREAGARRVVDLGCGEGRLMQALLKHDQFAHVAGIDVSMASLKRARRRLALDDMSERQQARVSLQQGSLLYQDARLDAFDAAALVEVIEHIDSDRLASMQHSVFATARPRTVVVTTPNREFNATFDGLGAEQLRHGDHRFEWTREEFSAWSSSVCEQHGYAAQLSGIGEPHAQFGAPTQMAVFTLSSDAR